MGGDLGTCPVCYYNWARWCSERYLDKQLTIDQEKRQRSPTRKLLSFSHDVVRTTSCSVWSLSHSRSFFSFPITVQRLIIAPHTVIQEHIRFDKLSQCSWYQDLGTKILAPRSWYQDLGTKILVPRSWSQDPGTKILEPRS